MQGEASISPLLPAPGLTGEKVMCMCACMRDCVYMCVPVCVYVPVCVGGCGGRESKGEIEGAEIKGGRGWMT